MKLTSLGLAGSLALAALSLGGTASARDDWHDGWHGGGHGHHGSVHIGVGAWRGGYWHHGWYGPRFGWWWTVPGGYAYYYPQPIYPYPAYDVAVAEPSAPPPPAASGAPPEQYWYYCDSPSGYYPYVSECRGAWRQVPVTPQGPVK